VIAGNSATNSNAFESVFYLLGFLTIAAGFWWLARQLVELWAPALRPNRARAVGFLASVSGLGAAPLVFLVGRPLVYEEAILWGVAFAAVALAASVSVFRRPRPLTIVTLVVADLLAVSARPTVGYSAVFATLVLGGALIRFPEKLGARQPGRATRWGLFLLVGAVVAVLSAPAVLYAKFGRLSPPYRDDIAVSGQPDMLKAVSHPLGIDPVVLPTKLFSLLRPDSLSIMGHPPYVELGEMNPTLVWPAKEADVKVIWERTSSLTATLPFSFAAMLVGLVAIGLAAKRWWSSRQGDPALFITALVLVSAVGAMVSELVFPGQTYRYLADWLPTLYVGVPVGLSVVAAGLPDRALSRGVLAVACLLLACQAVIQTAVAIENSLLTGGEAAAICRGPRDPFGLLGTIFCPGSLIIRPSP
jgi:hypothetical protein